MLFPLSPTRLQTLQESLFAEKQVSVAVLRLDQIHPVVSGNKLFKLHYFIIDALEGNRKGILSFGGAYSNHLVAVAFASQQAGLKAVGIVRGEKPAKLSPSLTECLDYGMDLRYLSREEYREKGESNFLTRIEQQFPGYQLIPEGGYHPKGAAGAALISEMIPVGTSHVCCAAGTATTLAGLLLGAQKRYEIVGFNVLKGMSDMQERLHYLTNTKNLSGVRIDDDYHFGGYAKKNKLLLDFMNQFYLQHGVPTDFVYTAKMMFGVLDSIKRDVFAKGSNIICLHTGGLQGNRSLPPEALVFN
jgi:1-aminocyclopropane-1-carboxylate deaminase/D-cysteine desulfhydrase-like pyridoxal-dependent ACC family enzyme